MADHLVETSTKACQTAASQDELATAFEELADSMPAVEETRREAIASFLVEQVVLGPASSRVTTALDRALDACGIQATLRACSQTFLEAAHVKIESPSSLQTSLRSVRRFLLSVPESEEALWVCHLNTCGTGARQDLMIKASIESIVTSALLLPSQIANACHRQMLVLPAWCVRSRYCPRLLECALAMVAISESHESVAYVQILAQKMVHSGGSDEVAIALHHYYDQSCPTPACFEKTVLGILQGLSTQRGCATLMRSILRHWMSKVTIADIDEFESVRQTDLFAYLEAVCVPVLRASRDARENFVRLTVLSSSSSNAERDVDRMFCHCVAIILAACESVEQESSDEEESDDDSLQSEPTSVLRRHLNEVALSWSEPVFVQHTDLQLQRHVTHFLLSAITLLDSNSEDASSSLVSTLLSGVTARLASSLDNIRRDGMRVAELLATRLDQPLRFEELDDERKEEERDMMEKDGITTKPSTGKETASKNIRREKRVSCRKAAKLVDPDAEYSSDEEDSDDTQSDDDADRESSFSEDVDSVWDNDETLIPYNLEDDEEDLRETPSPVYLRECLDQLRTPDTDDSACSRHETAIQAVASLVRSSPADLPDLTVPLCKQLLHMENKFDLPGFDVHQAAGLLSLTVLQPVLAGEFMINEFFGSIGLGTRLSVLCALENGAYELCGAKAVKEERQKLASKQWDPSEPRISGKRRLVADSALNDELQLNVDRATSAMESRTRRWGKGRRHARPLCFVNAFGPVAPSWFYALVSGFVKHKDDAAIWGGANGARLLASFLVTLATIVECSGLDPGSEILAKDLIELAWSFRTVEVPEVRTAVLVAIANSLVLLRDDALISVLYGHGDLAEFLRKSALEDSDETCRSIASTISDSVSQILGGVIDSRNAKLG